MTSDLFLPLPQILLTQVPEVAQNMSVLVMSPSKTAPWQLSYDTDYPLFLSDMPFHAQAMKLQIHTSCSGLKNLQVDDVDVVIPVSLCSGGVHTA